MATQIQTKTPRERVTDIVERMSRHLEDPRPLDVDWFSDMVGDLKEEIENEYRSQVEQRKAGG